MCGDWKWADTCVPLEGELVKSGFAHLFLATNAAGS